MKRTAIILIAGVALLCLPTVASAQGCKGDKRPVPGTLAAANGPCAQPKAAPNRESATTDDKKKEQPGMFKSGNTTFYFGGSIGTEVGVRGR